MEKFSERLRKAMKIRKVKAIQISRATNINRSTIANYLRDEYQPKSDKTFKIAQALNVNPAWLLGYDVDMELPLDTRLATQDDIDNLANNTLFTDFNYYKKGYIIKTNGNNLQEILKSIINNKVPVPIKFKPNDDDIYLFKINDTSMDNVFKENSIVVALDDYNYNSTEYTNGIIVVGFYKNEVIIKRFYIEDEYILLKSDSKNLSHKTIIIPKKSNNFTIIGRVVWHLNPSDMEKYYK